MWVGKEKKVSHSKEKSCQDNGKEQINSRGREKIKMNIEKA